MSQFSVFALTDCEHATIIPFFFVAPALKTDHMHRRNHTLSINEFGVRQSSDLWKKIYQLLTICAQVLLLHLCRYLILSYCSPYSFHILYLAIPS